MLLQDAQDGFWLFFERESLSSLHRQRWCPSWHLLARGKEVRGKQGSRGTTGIHAMKQRNGRNVLLLLLF